MKLNEARISIQSILIIFLVISSCSVYKTEKRKEIKNAPLSSLVLTGYGSASYKEDSIKTYLDELKTLNANTASFLYTCYVNNKDDPNINCLSYDSPKLSRLSAGIKLAKKRNFHINLRIYVDLKDQQWRCLWNPVDKKKVFKSLKKELTQFAKFSEEHQVELLIIGAEYCELTKNKFKDNWKDIIFNIRSYYKGALSYGANWGRVGNSTEYKEIGFWQDLDFIGIDHYHPLPNTLNEQKIMKFQKDLFKDYQKISALYNKPILITELGFPGDSKGYLQPYEWKLKGKTDQSRQALNYKATLKAIKSVKKIQGLFIWRKEDLGPNKMLTYKKDHLGFALFHRKAWYEIKNFFKSY